MYLAPEMKSWMRRTRRRPAVFLASTLSLGVAIGAVTALHAVVEATLLHPIARGQGAQIVGFKRTPDRTSLDAYRYLDRATLAERSDLFEHVAASGPLWPDHPIEAGAVTARAATGVVSFEFFTVLDASMTAGRPFQALDDRLDAAPVAVLSYEFARARFGDAGAAVGRTVRISETPAVVVGVLHASFRDPDVSRRPSVYLPMSLMPRVNPVGFEWVGPQSPMWVRLVARLRPRVTIDAARAALASASRFETAPARRSVLESAVVDIDEAAIPPMMWQEFRTILLMLSGAAGALLLVACFTVGTLILVQLEERRAELAVQSALGASRRRVVVWTWVEGLLPAVLGAAIALPIGHAMLSGLASFAPRSGPLFVPELMLNARVAAGALLLSLLASVLVLGVGGRGAHSDPSNGMLRSGALGSAVASTRGRQLLVFVQIACAMALATGTVLLMRSVLALYAVDLGYRVEGLTEAQLDLTTVRLSDDERRRAYDAVELALERALPGAAVGRVEREWMNMGVPLLASADAVLPPGRHGPHVQIRTVTPGYLEALGVRVIDGRLFEDGDDRLTERPAVISEALARQIAPRASALGLRLGAAAGVDRPMVVGIVNDVRRDPLDRSRPTVYTLTGNALELALASGLAAVADRTPRRTTWLLRSNAIDVAARVIRQQSERWPGASVTLSTTADRLARQASPQRVGVAAVGAVGGIVLVLAMLSVFVLLRSTICAQRRDLAVRSALGASRTDLVWLLARDTVFVTAAGIAAGAVGAHLGAGLLAGLLFGVKPADAASYAGAGLVLILTTAIVAGLPALRVATEDLVGALHES